MFQKNLLVPPEVYTARVNEAHIPIVEQYFFDNIDFFPACVRNDPDFAKYCLRMGHAYMKRVTSELAIIKKYNGDSREITELGDPSFSWKFDTGTLDSNNVSQVCICAGAGGNISFELELAQRYPAAVIHLLDPSPQAVAYVSSLNLPSNITFHQVGLAGEPGVLEFVKPNIKGLGSLSAKTLVRGTEKFQLSVTSVAEFCKENQIGRIDLLKFDIEGCEHEVIQSLTELPQLPLQLAFELDQPTPIWHCEATMKRLYSIGYQVVEIWGLNVLAVRRQ